MPDQPIVSTRATDLYQRLATGNQPDADDADALSELLNLNLIRRAHGGATYTLEDPAYAGARLAATFHGEAARQLELAGRAAEAFDALGAAYGARIAQHDAGLVEHLSGIETINGRLGHIFADCIESFDVFQPTRRIAANLARVRARDLATLGRGVRMRTLYHEDIRTGTGMEDWVAEMTAAGAEIRMLDAVFPRLFIIDRRITVIPGDEPDVARIVHDPGVAGFLTGYLFDLYWGRARPWGMAEECAPSVVVPDSRQQRILELLAAGKSSKEIGTLLELKPRRMAEIVAELKELYGAETLFQLASRWLSSSGA